MTTKTWDGSNNTFTTAADWSPSGAPQPGDTAVINAGTVGIANATLNGLVIDLNGTAGSAPALDLSDSALGADSQLVANADGGVTTINAAGAVLNAGLISFTGPSDARFTTSLINGSDGSPAVLHNTGSIAAIGASPNFVTTDAGQTLANDGAISVWNPSNDVQFAIIGPAITGNGSIMLDAYAQAELVHDVGAGQTVQFFNNGIGNSSLQLDDPADFHGTIAGFAATDTITLRNTPFTSFNYAATDAGSGVLTLTDNGATVASLAFTGSYQTSDFNLGFGTLSNGQTYTQVTTTQAAGDQMFHITDAALNQSTTDAGVAYTGPVSYLQHQFIWSSPDAVAISASAPNVFLHGGSAGDALAVSSGQNVLDGGGGSNFLVGGTGAGSQDTFFLDGRGGVETWSTIVNFHQGDQATIFGFHKGVSTLPFTDSDGADGFKGLTIHSELNGAGTGVNGSITFTGIDRATADAHFTITSGTLLPGTANAVDYLLIQCDH